MKIVTGTVVASRSFPLDWEEDECLCQGKIPEAKRVDVLNRVFDEKRDKHRWKVMVRYHQDCPIHGCNRSD